MSEILIGNCLDVLPTLEEQSVHTCVTSPPYWGLRDYGKDDQLGLEETPEEYVSNMVKVFGQVRRVLRDDGTLWLNLGDSYAHSLRQSGKEYAGKLTRGSKGTIVSVYKPLPIGLKSKDLVGIPWRVAFALQADGWYLRQDIIWHKPNPMPESVTDRCTKAHEYIFLLSKDKDYFYDHEAIKENAKSKFNGGGNKGRIGAEGWIGHTENLDMTRNKRSVWTVTTKPFKGAHFATFPPDLIEPCILAGCPKGGIVLDPFAGAGTTGLVAKRFGCDFVGIELNPEYAEMARTRIENEQDVLFN